MNLAIIPARGGSKRIPKKNIKIFNGRPIIYWPIKAAIESKLFDEIIVSTDDDEIAEIAKNLGASVPFKRPKELSDDYTGITPVIAHAINWALKSNIKPDFACCICATAPMIDSVDLIKSYNMIKEAKCDYVFSISSYRSSIFRSLQITANGNIKMNYPENFNKRSQDLPSAFFDAAQFYWGKIESWVGNKKIFDENSKGYVLPEWKVKDIDTLDDWIYAEIMQKVTSSEK